MTAYLTCMGIYFFLAYFFVEACRETDEITVRNILVCGLVGIVPVLSIFGIMFMIFMFITESGIMDKVILKKKEKDDE